MKKANEIVNHLLKPYNSKLNHHRCLNKIISSLPSKYNKYISKVVLKGEFLYIITTHSIIKQELFYNQRMIFNIIKTLHMTNQCLNINPKKIVIKNIYKPKVKNLKPIPKYYFKELKGDFEIKAKNDKLKNLFQEIKEVINGK